MDNVLDRLDTAIKEYLTSLDTDALDDTDHRRAGTIPAIRRFIEGVFSLALSPCIELARGLTQEG